MRKKTLFDILLFLFFFIFAGILSLNFGMERAWDTRNYHIYSPYAFLSDRLTTDIMPAGIQSYFNPLSDVPYFLMIKYFNNFPEIITFIWGFSYALYIFIIYKFASFIFQKSNKILLTLISVLLASGVSIVVRSIGWLPPDILVCDLIFISLYLLLKHHRKYGFKLYFLIGSLSGIAVGLKLTSAIFVIPILVSFLFFYKLFDQPIKSFITLLFGMFCGFLLIDGFWLYKLYVIFGNPFFPYFNWIFHSSYITLDNVYTEDFGNHVKFISGKIWFYPFADDWNSHFRLLWWAFVVNLFTIPFIKRDEFFEYFNVDVIYADFLLVFCFVAYILWVNTFGTIRYYAPIIGFAGIVSIIVLMKLFLIYRNIILLILKDKNLNFSLAKNVFIFVSSLCLLLFFFPNYHLRYEKKLLRIPAKGKIFDIENLKIPDNSIVITKSGTAFLIPFQNPKARYISLNSYIFTHNDVNLLSDEKYNEVRELINSRSDKIYILSDVNLEDYKDVSVNEIKDKLLESIKSEKVISNLKKNYVSENFNKRIVDVMIKFIKSRGINATEAALYELNKLGLNIKSISCSNIGTNIENSELGFKQHFYYCKINCK